MLPTGQTIVDRGLRLNLLLERRVHFYAHNKAYSRRFVNRNIRIFAIVRLPDGVKFNSLT